MANRFARKTGNWNASDVWSDTPSGTAGAQYIPGVGDVAIANSYTVTVNVNATCAEVRNDTTGGATNGGKFSLSDGVTLTANVYAGTPTNTGTVQYAGSTSATLIGDTIAGGGTGSYGIHHSGTGTLTVTGSVTGGSGSSNCYGIYNASTGIINITGNVTGGSGTNAVGAYNTSTGTITISGNATGGSGSGATGAHNASTGTLRAGVAVGNDHGPGYTSNNFNVGVYGYGTNSGGQPTTTVGGIKYGAYGMSPTSGRVLFDPNHDASATAILIRETTFAQVTFTGPSNTSADPAESDVRYGTSYRFGAKTGTCRVPAASSVLTGVPVDNTTGTATIGASDIRAAVGLASANLDTQLSTLAGYVGYVDTEVAAIKAKTDNLPASPAAVSDVTAVPASVWSYITRTLTAGGGGGGATAQEVWEYATRTLTADSAGVTTLLSRIGSALTISSGKVTVGTNDDKSGYTLSSAGIQAIWDALTSALTTAGSIGKRIVDYLDVAVSSRSTYAGGDTSGTTTLLSRIIGTLASGTHQPQSGDAFARLGAPAGASISADIATRATFGTPVTLITSGDIIPGGLDWTLAGIRDNVLATKLKTDHLPSSPASSGDVSTVGAAVAALHDFDPSNDIVAHVALVDTVSSGGGGDPVEIAGAVRVELAPELASVAAIEDRLAEQVADGPVLVIAAPAAGQTTAWVTCHNEHGAVESGVTITIKVIGASGAGGAYDAAPAEGVSDEDGLAQIAIPRGTGLRFAARRGASGQWVKFDGVDAETLALPRLIGMP